MQVDPTAGWAELADVADPGDPDDVPGDGHDRGAPRGRGSLGVTGRRGDGAGQEPDARPGGVPVADDAPPEALRRARALLEAGISPTWSEERFDRIARLAARLVEVPMAVINLVTDRQVTKASHGIVVGPTPWEDSLCRHAVVADAALEVDDLSVDARFDGNVFVTGDPHLRFYAAEPLRLDGVAVGTLCVMDTRARTLDAHQREVLDELAAWAESELSNASLNALVARSEEQHRLLRLLLTSAGDGIVGSDRDGRIVFANPAATRVLGREAPDVVGRVLHDIAHHTRPDGTPFPVQECPSHAAITVGEAFPAHEDVFWRPDGSPVPVEMSVAPMVVDGEVHGAVSTFRDITERQEVARLRAELSAVVSHELRTPLTSIRGSLRLLEAGALGPVAERQAPVLRMAAANAERLGALVDDILDLARMDAGHLPLRPVPVDGADLVRAVVDALDGTAHANEVTLRLEPVEGPVPLLVDPDRLGQALTNIVGNALKFTEPGGTVTVHVERRDDGRAGLVVTDTGRGIPADRLHQVFDRFVHIDGPATRTKGTGLGLSITRGIVERSGGTVEVTSELGVGSCFAILLPLAEEGEP